MSPGIYYLIARNIKTNEKVQIELTDRNENRYCTVLSYIDSLTTQFINKEQLIKRLYDNGYINFMDADIYIEYNHNGLKFEEVMYNNMEGFAKLSVDSESKLDPNDSLFNTGVNSYIAKLDSRHFRSYVLNSSKVNNKFKEHIETYYKSQYLRDSDFNRKKLVEDLESYKLFRDFSYIVYEYENPNYKHIIEEKNKERLQAKLIKNKVSEEQPVKENQIEFNISNNEIQLPNTTNNQILQQTIQEQKEEREEFLTEDDYNQNYYPNNIRK